MIFNELNTGFRWYDNVDKQTRFKEQCSAVCEYGLIAPCNDLLPFQIKLDSFGTPTSWLLKYLDGEMLVPTVTPSVDPCTSWAITNSVGAGSVNIYDSVTNLIYASADFTTSLDNTMDILVTSASTNTSLGTIFTGFGATFNNSAGWVVSWDVPTQTLTLCAPVGSGDIYNGNTVRFAVNGGTWGGDAGVLNTISGGVDSSTSYAMSDTIDITTCLPFLNQYTIDGFDYLQYNGLDITGCLLVQMECGKWYSQITDGTNTVYSEVFEVQPISDIDFEQSRFPLFTAWRWYDDINKQTRYKEYCQELCDFHLLTGNDRLLPFQIRVPVTSSGITWKLVSTDGQCEHYLDTTLLSTIGTSDEDRITYDGSDMTGLPCGKFYSVLFDGVNTWYSELIEITDAIVMAEDFYILQETGFKILQETGFGILQE